MTDTDAATAVPPPQFDAFSAVLKLVELVLDPREFQGKLAELKAAEDRAAKELRRLELARQSHDRAIAKDRAEIEEERAALRKREVAAVTAENKLADTVAAIDKFKADAANGTSNGIRAG
jgi:multidrug resistance efflux pump